MRAHGLGEIVVLGTDIYEMFTTALRRLVESACLKLPFLRSSRNHQVYCGMRPIPCLRGLLKAKRISKAGSARDTSTKYFVVWKTLAGIFSRLTIQNPPAWRCQVPGW